MEPLVKSRRRGLAVLVVGLAITMVAVSGGDQLGDSASSSQPTPRLQAYFSPNGGATKVIVQELSDAKQSIRILAYSFTSAPIAGAVRDAHRRGVDVQVVLDKSQETAQYSSATFLHNAGVPVFIDAEHAIQHNKVMIIDDQTLITGSFNFTKAAEERNAENLLVIKDHPELLRKYVENWQLHREHSHVYRRE